MLQISGRTKGARTQSEDKWWHFYLYSHDDVAGKGPTDNGLTHPLNLGQHI
jgi:hypothetical protein